MNYIQHYAANNSTLLDSMRMLTMYDNYYQAHATLNTLHHLLVDPSTRDLGMQCDLPRNEMGDSTTCFYAFSAFPKSHVI